METKNFHSTNEIFLMKTNFLKMKKTFCLVEVDEEIPEANQIFISLQDEGVTEVAGNGEADASQLDPKNLKVAELRAELEARNLPSKGETELEIFACDILK